MEEPMEDVGHLMLRNFPEARRTRINMAARALAAFANFLELFDQSSHPDLHAWAFVLVPSVLIPISVERVPLATRVKGCESTRMHIALRRGVQGRIPRGATALVTGFMTRGAMMW